MINILKKFLDNNNLDGFIIPKNDSYFTEYSKINNLSKLTNFTGSAGFSVVLKKKTIYLLMADIHFKQKHNLGKNLKFLKSRMFGQKI